MTMQWRALPERQPGEVLRDINFRVELDNGQRTDRVTAQFRHRDNRVWVARITSLNDPHLPRYNKAVQLSSGGCRNYRFVAHDLPMAKQVVQRFANLAEEHYDRLVADAQSTMDYPRSDDIGVFRMSVAKQRRAGWGGHRTETRRYTIEGLGRVDGNTITIFQTSEEIGEILLLVCPRGVQPLVPAGINEITPTAGPRFNRSALDETEVPELDEDEVQAAIARSFDDDLETALTGLHDGSYSAPRPRGREAREIDFGGDDE